jgi:exosortase J
MQTALSSPNAQTGPNARLVPETLSPQTAVKLACLSAALGLFALFGPVRLLANIWSEDALKSVGLAVPFVCFALLLRDWRELGWETEGTWWGFALLAFTVALMFVRDETMLIVTVNKQWLLQLPPIPLLAVIYAASLVLLFGGTKLLRHAWFPVALMWAVIPVPQTFARRVDVPLQHIGASVARSFAHLIGVRLNSTDLKIMFSPTTGMFIAPGCDGLRGSITMGLTAIAVAYYYRFRWYVFLPIVAGGVLLGYIFNFVRLCSMVIYDRITVAHPALGPHEQLADHIVGGCIFVAALAIFFTAIEKLKRPAAQTVAPIAPSGRVPAWPIYARVGAVALLALIFGADYAHTTLAQDYAAPQKQKHYAPLPAMIGGYRLARTWTDETSEGAIVYLWGEYVAPGQNGEHISVGISPRMNVHEAEVCHIAKGEDPSWRGQMASPSANGQVDLSLLTYSNDAAQKLEASTICDGGVCRQFSQNGKHVSLMYAAPHRDLPLQSDAARPVPVLLKVETADTAAPPEVAAARMQATITAFLQGADLVALTAPYNQR